ncbi:MAG TPA: anhydro-N-acetylmuramic acid kinase [Gammaproteobacteria bacterium]|nr:anhydro-N-acetylmuramic acid kinase [Gammaproteobacteria bacterium]
MSGTSVDGIDAALVDLSGTQPQLTCAHTYPWSADLRERILTVLTNPDTVSLQELGGLDAQLGEAFANAALELIAEAELQPGQVTAIGNHGQTLFHAPDATPAFSLQAGDANRIAELTGITTVADFRRRDIAAGGQGAPLVPAFHRALFHDPDIPRAVLNIGGMANLTLLPTDADAVTGFDTGPGNVLLDAWHHKHRQGDYDSNGDWARSGELNPPLLEQLLAHPYFSQPPPKSTGRELFCLRWLEQQLQTGHQHLPAADIQRTLLELTARSISLSLQQATYDIKQLLVCGGGVHNGFLMQRLQSLLPDCDVESTETYGLHPDWVEAVAFAWLAKQTLAGKPGNLPAVTGASRAVVLGAIYSRQTTLS